jgi:mannitol/fructose-specific phosphotransferase system IIA component (Ntr-type)
VALIDPNPRATALAKRAGLPALAAEVVTIDMEENPECYGVGNILAITERDEVNAMACQHFRGEQGDLNLYRWRDRELPEEAVRDPSMIVGDPVWQPLQLQNLRALEFDNDGKNLSRATIDVERIRHPERVLLCVYDGKITPFVPPEAKGPCDVLCYEPFVASMDTKIRPEWVKISEANTFDELFAEMLSCLSADFPEIDLEQLHRDLVHRENDFSSLVGYDVSLPHLYTEALDHSVVLVAKLRKPLKDLHSDDEIRYVFIVLSPQDQPKVHLQALAELSQFIMDESNRRHLEKADDNASLVEVFFTER